MELSWQNDDSSINMLMSNGDTLNWQCKLWSRSGKDVHSGIFKPLNDFWKGQSPDRVARFENVYRKIYNLFEEYDLGVREFRERLRTMVDELFSFYNWKTFSDWCMINGAMYLRNGIKDSLDEKDKEELTYMTKDYEELMVFSVMLKTIMPVWGMFERHFQRVLETDHLIMSLGDLVKVNSIATLSPWAKLNNYVEYFSGERIKNLGYTLLKEMSSEEIPWFLISLAMVKKIIIYDVRNPNYSIVTNVYHLLNERCSEVSNSKPLAKKVSDDDKKDITVTDQYKIRQLCPPAVSELVSFYVSDPERLTQAIEPKVTKTLLKKYADRLKGGITWSEFHVPILAVVVNGHVNRRVLRDIPYEQMVSLTIACAAILEVWKMEEIAELITTSPTEKDIYQLTLSSTSNRSFNQLRPDILKELEMLYPFSTRTKLNPGQTLIENIIKEILRFDWKIESENFVDLRNTLALLILKVGGKTNHGHSITQYG